jgi:hypothetical protein
MTNRKRALLLTAGVAAWLLTLGMWVSAQTSVISGGGGAATSVSAAAFPLRGPDGTAGAPTYSAASDTDTGMFFGGVGTGILNFTVDGTTRFQVLNSGGSAAISIGASADAGLTRQGAGILRAGNPTGDGWIQNAAGDQFLTANHTNATITPTNITDLTTSLTTTRKYVFRFVAQVDNSTDADGLRFDFDGGTVTATDFRVTCKTFANNAVGQTQQTTALATDITLATLTGTGEFECDGSIETSNTGTLIPRAAGNTAASGTLTVFRGSHLLVKDMP